MSFYVNGSLISKNTLQYLWQMQAWRSCLKITKLIGKHQVSFSAYKHFSLHLPWHMCGTVLLNRWKLAVQRMLYSYIYHTSHQYFIFTENIGTISTVYWCNNLLMFPHITGTSSLSHSGHAKFMPDL